MTVLHIKIQYHKANGNVDLSKQSMTIDANNVFQCHNALELPDDFQFIPANMKGLQHFINRLLQVANFLCTKILYRLNFVTELDFQTKWDKEGVKEWNSEEIEVP